MVAPPELTIIVPAFNEEARIEAAIDAVVEQVAGSGETFEVLCVDDGSTDATADRVERVAARDPRVRLERLRTNRGKGAAVRAGVFAAHGRFIFVLDADLSAPPALIDTALVQLRNGSVMVTGSRHCPGARLLRRQFWLRRMLGRAFFLLAREVADRDATDFTCGFKGFRAEAARRVFGRVQVSGWAFDAETALIGRRLGLARREIPVPWTNDPDSRVRVGRAVWHGLIDLARIKLNDKRGVYGPDSGKDGAW